MAMLFFSLGPPGIWLTRTSRAALDGQPGAAVPTHNPTLAFQGLFLDEHLR